jgi:hypothetical protein
VRVSLKPNKKKMAKDPLIHPTDGEELVSWGCPECGKWMGGFTFAIVYPNFVQCTRCLNEFNILKERKKK